MKKAVYFTLGLIILSLLTNANVIDGTKNPLNPSMNERIIKKPSSLVLKAPSSGAKCFDENTRIINVGIGLGYSYYHYSGPGYSHKNLPTISVSYEQPWSKRFGPGLMGIGGYLAIKNSSWKEEYNDGYGSYTYKDSYNDIIVASRAMYHWDVLNKEKAEVYGGVVLGVRISSHHYSDEYTGSWVNNGHQNSSGNDMSVGIAYAIVAGARYYFTPKFGVYGELSYGISYITVGVSFKF